MASISQLPSGKWQAQLSINGIRKSKSFISKREGQGWAAQQEFTLRHETNREQNINYPAFVEIINRYMRDVSPLKRGVRWEEIRLKKLMKLDFTSLPLNQVTTEHFAVYRDSEFRRGLKPESVRRELILFSGVFTKAIKEMGLQGARKPHHRAKETASS